MIQLKNIVLRRGIKAVLNQASATINPGEKVGLVGRNGAGKSSLFALLNGSLHEDQGSFLFQNNGECLKLLKTCRRQIKMLPIL